MAIVPHSPIFRDPNIVIFMSLLSRYLHHIQAYFLIFRPIWCDALIQLSVVETIGYKLNIDNQTYLVPLQRYNCSLRYSAGLLWDHSQHGIVSRQRTYWPEVHYNPTDDRSLWSQRWFPLTKAGMSGWLDSIYYPSYNRIRFFCPLTVWPIFAFWVTELIHYSQCSQAVMTFI